MNGWKTGTSEASCRTVGQLRNPVSTVEPWQTVEPWVNCGTTSERLEPWVIGATPGKGRPGRWRDLGHWSSVEPWANCGTLPLGQLWNPGPTVEPWVSCGTLGQLWNLGPTVEPWANCGTLGQLWNRW